MHPNIPVLSIRELSKTLGIHWANLLKSRLFTWKNIQMQQLVYSTETAAAAGQGRAGYFFPPVVPLCPPVVPLIVRGAIVSSGAFVCGCFCDIFAGLCFSGYREQLTDV